MTAHLLTPRRDGGATLVELLVSIVLIGMVVVAALTGLATGISATRAERTTTRPSSGTR